MSMNEELRQLLQDVKDYIENTEVSNDSEWGTGRSLEELQKSGEMPQIYSRVGIALNDTNTLLQKQESDALQEARGVANDLRELVTWSESEPWVFSWESNTPT